MLQHSTEWNMPRYPTLIGLLSRANEHVLQELLGADILRLLHATLGSRFNVAKLREVLLGLRATDELLRKPESRMLLLELLRPDELGAISADVFGRDLHSESLGALQAIRTNSSMFRALCTALDVSMATAAPAEQLPACIEVTSGYSLFRHQRKVVANVQSRLSKPGARVVVHMPTGAGKTRTAMAVVADHLRKTEPGLVVWLATSEELCEQAAQEFARSWHSLGDRSVGLWRAWGACAFDRETVRDIGEGLLVAGLAKLSSASMLDATVLANLGDRVSLVVFDEAHQVIAPTYRSVVENLVNRNPDAGLLGLTATPGRTWNDRSEDRLLATFFGESKVRLEIEGFDSPLEYLIEEGYLARPEFKRLSYSGGTELTAAERRRIASDFEIPDFVAERLAAHEFRNLAIVQEAERLLRSHRRVLLFGATVKHAELMSVVLSALGHNAACVSGATASPERARLISWFKASSLEPRLLCNYGVLTTGFDAPQTSAAIIARPTKSLVLYSQMVGRAIRGLKAGGNERAEVVTLVDTGLPGFGDLGAAFNNWEDVW